MKRKATFKGDVTRSAFIGTAGAGYKALSAVSANSAPRELTDEQLAKINTFARKPLAKEQVHYTPLLMAHNGIDRDNERFNEELLANFAQTLPGKGFFVQGHPGGYSGKGGPGEGLYFAARVEDITPDEFKALTGETLKLPEGITQGKALFADAYVLALDSNADTRAKIDAGIIRFASIGFKAPLFDITDERGNYIYGEYRSGGEAREGSLVWLGAQPGAGVIKSVQDDPTKQTEERHPMKTLLEKLNKALKKEFTEDNLGDGVILVIADKDMQIEKLKAAAAEGAAYRKHLTDDIVKHGMLIGEMPTDEAGQKAEVDFIATWPIDRVKALKDKYETAARQKFPDKFTVPTKDQTDRDQKGSEAEGKAPPKDGKKDLTVPANNELLQVK
jgi:hypothetical protein